MIISLDLDLGLNWVCESICISSRSSTSSSSDESPKIIGSSTLALPLPLSNRLLNFWEIISISSSSSSSEESFTLITEGGVAGLGNLNKGTSFFGCRWTAGRSCWILLLLLFFEAPE